MTCLVTITLLFDLMNTAVRLKIKFKGTGGVFFSLCVLSTEEMWAGLVCWLN